MSIASNLTALAAAKAAIAAAISERGGTVGAGDGLADFAACIDALPQGGGSADATATAAHILAGKTAYIAGGKVTGSMPNNGGVYQEILDNWDYWQIPAGYHDGEGGVIAHVAPFRLKGGDLDTEYIEYGEGTFSTGAIGFIPDYVVIQNTGNPLVRVMVTALGSYNAPGHPGSIYVRAYGSTAVNGTIFEMMDTANGEWTYTAVKFYDYY
ncbi:MAG: hypothetical protein WDA00_06415 [Eubacteriales bacterium]